MAIFRHFFLFTTTFCFSLTSFAYDKKEEGISDDLKAKPEAYLFRLKTDIRDFTKDHLQDGKLDINDIGSAKKRSSLDQRLKQIFSNADKGPSDSMKGYLLGLLDTKNPAEVQAYAKSYLLRHYPAESEAIHLRAFRSPVHRTQITGTYGFYGDMSKEVLAEMHRALDSHKYSDDDVRLEILHLLNIYNQNTPRMGEILKEMLTRKGEETSITDYRKVLAARELLVMDPGRYLPLVYEMYKKEKEKETNPAWYDRLKRKKDWNQSEDFMKRILNSVDVSRLNQEGLSRYASILIEIFKSYPMTHYPITAQIHAIMHDANHRGIRLSRRVQREIEDLAEEHFGNERKTYFLKQLAINKKIPDESIPHSAELRKDHQKPVHD